ncbi:Coenzyme A biosynthesis bifunctional protein CoaBC [Thalassoglobus neptunius]|uniref:Coenzyme A biosynthesis bifunctional protein CoaBC n=1 Tax=Thalassoglobus neptunius TaxID=1938619 RepID=A0A5C5X2T0_9PLAN|nr:flavoprotein [Thalassoglobus neptunius]TWT56909.1 Coenzyme A biosynthesis bifunctional protein CoaBC [Thalassoglobus neptunius]
MSSLQDREILVGVSGGIAAYKVADLVSQSVQAGARVTVVMTESSLKFIGKTTFEALTGRPVYTELFSPQEHFIGEHIGLARRAELFLIAPATANAIARIAHGFADDQLTTLSLAVTCPVYVAPAMNNEMWSKPAVQRNIQQLQDDGIRIIGPDAGWLSCQSVGPGRMAAPSAIREELEAAFS